MGHSEVAISMCSGFSEASLKAHIGSQKACKNEKQLFPSTDKWSREALRAIETHLRLLQQAGGPRSNSTLANERRDSKRLCVAANRRGNWLGLADLESEKGPLLELNSQAPLPDGWEQFLDLRTGQVYYIDWKNFKRSYVDPRKVLALGHEKATLSSEQARARSNLQSVLTDSDTISECLTDGSNYMANVESEEEMDVDSNWSIPMHKEDWDLMKARGWLSPNSDDRDDRSEISTEACSPSSDQSCFSSCEAESREMGKIVVMYCRGL